MIQYYDIKLERALLRAMVSGSDTLRDISDDTEFGRAVFSDKINQTIFTALIKYYRKRGTPPTKDVFQHFIVKYLQRSNIMTKSQQVDRYNLLIEKLYERSTTDKELDQVPQIREELINLKKGRSMQDAIIKASDFLDDGEIKTAEQVFSDFRVDLLSTADIADEGDYVRDFGERVKLMKLKRKHPELFSAVPTGIIGWNPDNPFGNPNPVPLDTFLDGGHYDGEFTMVLGDSGSGKSFELMEFAYNATLAGKNVAYFSIEMNKWKVQTRLDARISGIPFSKFRKAMLNAEEFDKWKQKLIQFNRNKKFGRIFVVGFYRGCTVSSIEAKAKDIEQVHGMPVDVMVIDYLNDVSPTSSSSHDSNWELQGKVSWGMKQLAGSWDRGNGIPVITANQGKSSASLSKFKTLSNGMVYFRRMRWNDAAFSPLPSHHATVIIGLLHSKGDENNVGTMTNHQIIKNRDNETNIGVLSFPNLSVCRLNSRGKYRKAKDNFESLAATLQQDSGEENL